eukprot:Plantae.Rhodophyta-Purpureofilum_apyrenoidigerum.ctg46423.p1 GENE.Plantae.Rhodophyta-Purpureofilum_apyrenoidigerum.ctg46423~~Plantae.Rhodophyta-Purpureofilum_apyrenoidigerum.ctg46423.p1  ORF type:complete len:461 (+),score=92.38 Plantae.Rhodophyta-Purpureofilum_apyrenoidigerum.ctg46423:229-1611(+)
MDGAFVLSGIGSRYLTPAATCPPKGGIVSTRCSPGKRVSGVLSMTASSASSSSKTEPAAPSWQDLALKIPNDFLNPDYVNGEPRATPPWERDCIRLFGQAEDDIKFIFYRDTSYWCPYCHRVQLYLEEKKIPYRFQKVNLKCYGRQPGWYLKKNNTGSLPMLEIGRRFKLESLQIMLKIEQQFPDGIKLLPQEPEQKRVVERHLGVERKLCQAWLRCLRWPVVKTEQAKAELFTALKEVEQILDEYEGPFFMGENLTVTDCMYAPFLERQVASLLYWKGIRIRNQDDYPNLERWFQAMEARPAYRNLKMDDYSIVRTLPPQIGPCKTAPDAASFREEIENRPVNAKLDGSDDSLGARYAAAAMFINHHEVVVRDALKGLGERENQELHDQIDLAFRFAMKALIEGGGKVDLRDVVSKKVAEAARFERKRVCVPRDLSSEAATQFQGSMNWLIGCIEKEQV